MKISIIIPVYRVEAYINECVDSVLCQDYSDFEVILVDDGSPDRCGEICDAYATRDSRIKVIHKENGGLSDARNAGLARATGDYVLFLDSDDYWNDPHVLTRLAERVQLTAAELLNFSYQKFFEDTGTTEPYFPITESMPHPLRLPQQLDWLTERGLYIASACNKMICRSLLEGLTFRKGVFSEDIEWCAALLLRADSVDFVPESFYCYRQRSGSIRHSIRDKNCRDLADAIMCCLPHMIEKPFEKTSHRFIAVFTIIGFLGFFVYANRSFDEEFNALGLLGMF